MTPLATLLAARIRAGGPITLADYMAECLLHPQHGYYSTREPFGSAGDFTTAPEISQVFGELIGLCLAQAWLDQGAPTPFALAEFGPGRGTLMADILRATKAVPGFHAGLRLILVEASPRLRAVQAQTLAPWAPTFLDRVHDLPDLPLFLVANEFFDALPIRQFQRAGAGWRERLVGVTGGGLGFGLGPVLPVPALSPRLNDTAEGQVVEICPAAPAIMADLTAHVDFAALAAACPPAACAYTTQGALLTALGIAQRSGRLAQNLAGAALQSHLAAIHRLTAPQEMGTLFKVLAVHPALHPPLPGSG
jgi:NADH dehydrogenase [ubiquinone] 1 alpha subcomplex assembly factor 7